MLSWSIEDDRGHYIDITLANGERWSKEAACSLCAAANMFVSKDIINGMNNYYDTIGTPEEGRDRFLAGNGYYGEYGYYNRVCDYEY